MHIKSMVLAATMLAFTHGVSAAIVDNGTYTTVDGVDWLDLTETAGMSYNDVTAQMGIGGTYEGWSYASRLQVRDLWATFGGDVQYLNVNGISPNNNGLFDIIAPLFGDLYCTAVGCATGEGYSYWRTGDEAAFPTHTWQSLSYDLSTGAGSASGDWFEYSNRAVVKSDTFIAAGSALIRTSTVPVPASVLLFRIARRKVCS